MSALLHEVAVPVDANMGVSRQDEQLLGNAEVTVSGSALVGR